MRQLHLIIGRLTNQTLKKTHALKNDSGQLLTNPDAQTSRWKQHLKEISNVAEVTRYHDPIVINIPPNENINTDTPNIEEKTNDILKL